MSTWADKVKEFGVSTKKQIEQGERKIERLKITKQLFRCFILASLAYGFQDMETAFIINGITILIYSFFNFERQILENAMLLFMNYNTLKKINIHECDKHEKCDSMCFHWITDEMNIIHFSKF